MRFTSNAPPRLFKGVDNHSFASLLLSTFDDQGNELGCATGFVYRLGQQAYLVTCWHVVTGRNYETNIVEPGHGKQPAELRVFALDPNELDPNEEHSYSVARVEHCIPLYRRNGYPNEEERVWIQNSGYQRIDIAAIPLQGDPRFDPPLNPVAQIGIEDEQVDALPEVAFPVSVVGYMRGTQEDKHALPIWKTGYIASEPCVGDDNQPRFLIDARTRRGMSGSPVFMRTDRCHRLASDPSVLTQGGSPQTKFVGLYSGRIGAAGNSETDIGIVWRPDAIRGVISGSAKPSLNTDWKPPVESTQAADIGLAMNAPPHRHGALESE